MKNAKLKLHLNVLNLRFFFYYMCINGKLLHKAKYKVEQNFLQLGS